jgi:blocked early in transport 1
MNHRAPAASSLFDSYPGHDTRSRPSSSQAAARPAYGAYSGRDSPYTESTSQPNGHINSGFRPATPNKRGQYSTSVLEELESQNNDTATSLLSSKVSQLKQLTIAIGDEIRDSSQLADNLNNSFENTTVKLRGTMRRMLRMAERTGVGWKVWVLFFVAVWALFAWVWLF